MYADRAPSALTWYQDRPALSLSLIEATGASTEACILDVGSGASTLVDYLLQSGYRHVGVLDVSPAAFASVRQRLGARAADVEWFVGDVTEWVSPHPWDVWHDRALFHFLTDSSATAAAQGLDDA